MNFVYSCTRDSNKHEKIEIVINKLIRTIIYLNFILTKTKWKDLVTPTFLA